MYNYIQNVQVRNWTLVIGRTEHIRSSAVQKTPEGTWDFEWKSEILVRVEKNVLFYTFQKLCVHQLVLLAQSWMSVGAAGEPPSSTQRSESKKRQKFFYQTLSLYRLIWFLTLPLLLQRGLCEDRAGGWHRGDRGWRWGRGGGRGRHQLLWSTISCFCGGRAVAGALRAARGEGICVTPRSFSGRRSLPSGILVGLLPHLLPLHPAPFPPEVSVPSWWGRGGWGRLVLLGFPAGISEAGQRGAKPYPTASWALYSFL